MQERHDNEANKQLRVILVDIAPKDTPVLEMEARMAELENLVSTYGGVVIVKREQRRDVPDYDTFIGKGKLEEIYSHGSALEADIVVLGNIVKPRQIWKINEYFRTHKGKMEAWDRVDLILKIFALHASTPEARLQIELAAIHHMGPRIVGMGLDLSRQGGGGGGGGGSRRGQGETNTEIMKRHLKEQVITLKKELKRFERMRGEHRKSRARKGLPTVGIVGYTNAGKSELECALTKKQVYIADQLFATLGTSVGNMPVLHNGRYREILVNDTIGFIRDLPPQLIEAFSSTLEESVESDLLLHVMDAADFDFSRKKEVVEEILETIGAKQERFLVLNKIDLILPNRLEALKEMFRDEKNVFFVSAREKIGLDELKNALARHFFGEEEVVEAENIYL